MTHHHQFKLEVTIIERRNNRFPHRHHHKALGIKGNNRNNGYTEQVCHKCLTKGHTIHKCSNPAAKEAKTCESCTKKAGKIIYGHKTEDCKSSKGYTGHTQYRGKGASAETAAASSTNNGGKPVKK